MKFSEFNLDPQLLDGIDAIGFQDATPVQELAIPVIMQGKDLIASAQTGTGKTAAFLLPIINKIIHSNQEGFIKALIVVPTRELAVQIDQQMEGLSYFTPVRSIAVYGGSDGASFVREKQALSEGADIIICTPGRMIAHLNMGYVKLSKLETLILDEADRMLDMGFNDDIMKIISHLPVERQNLLFSATMPNKIRELAKKVLKSPEEINISPSKPAENVQQAAFVLYESQKVEMVKHILNLKELKSVIIFCSTKVAAKELNRELKKLNFNVDDIHSDLEQDQRKETLSKFKNRTLNILVATDILARGIDVEDIDLVINYDVPNSAEDYVHRVGRTARAQSKGVAITFIGEKDQGDFADIENFLGKSVPKGRLPEHLGEAPAYNPNSRGSKSFKYKKKGKSNKHRSKSYKKK